MSRGSRIYIGNLPPNIRQKGLEEIFSKYGKIISSEIKGDRGDPTRPLFGFVSLAEVADADKAVRSLNGHIFDGYRLRVEFTYRALGCVSNGPGSGRYSRRTPTPPRGGVDRRDGGYRVIVSGLPPGVSWRHLKDHFRNAVGDVAFADVFSNGNGVVEFDRYEYMRSALKKLDNTKFKTLTGEISNIRVKEEHLAAKKNIQPPPRTSPRRRISRSPPTHKRTRIRMSPLYSRSRSHSRSRSRSRTRRSRSKSHSCFQQHHPPSFPAPLPVPVVQPQPQQPLKPTTNTLEVDNSTNCKIGQSATKSATNSFHPAKINTIADLFTYVCEQGHEPIRDAEKLTFNEVVQKQTGLIGAKALYQLICHGHPELEMYYCSMCNHWTMAWKIFEHLNNMDHKLAYMKRHYKAMHNKAMATPDDGSRKKFVDSISKLIFKQEGSGRCENRMKTIINIGTFERLWPDYENSIDNSWKLMGEDEMNEEFFQSAPTGTGLPPAASLSSWVDVTAPQPVNHRPIIAKPPSTQGFIGSIGHRESSHSSQGQQKELAASSRSSQPQQMRQQQSELSVQNSKSNVLPLNAEEISEADWSLLFEFSSAMLARRNRNRN